MENLSAPALFELAMKHIYGDGVPESNVMSVTLLTQAREMGHVETAKTEWMVEV